jgi:hypothetical protein
MLKLISSIPSLASGIDSGQGIVHRSDEVSGVQMYRNVGHGGLIIEIQAVVLVRVERALLVISPPTIGPRQRRSYQRAIHQWIGDSVFGYRRPWGGRAPDLHSTAT